MSHPAVVVIGVIDNTRPSATPPRTATTRYCTSQQSQPQTAGRNFDADKRHCSKTAAEALGGGDPSQLQYKMVKTHEVYLGFLYKFTTDNGDTKLERAPKLCLVCFEHEVKGTICRQQKTLRFRYDLHEATSSQLIKPRLRYILICVASLTGITTYN